MEIQGRRRKLRCGAVRDEVKHACAATDVEAWEIASRFAADGFTAWIFNVEPGPGTAPRYRGVATLLPDRPQRRERFGTSPARRAS